MTDFTAWYAQRHGYPPFPWQAALAQRIAAGEWPDALTPPTSSGKTGAIDVWLWARLSGYPVPRRLVYVIDRRLVVDGVVHYAQALANSLPEAERPVVIVMRGGMTIDDDWVLDPTRPAIIVSTVDQAGSRLLFSGYGASPRAAPVRAALLGNDALWVLDEVHLAQPLLQTLATVNGMGAGIRVLPMSATWDSATTHGLGPEDQAHPILSPRLHNPKPAKLVRLKGEDDLVGALRDEALTLREGDAGVVAVVCSRVATARAVFEQLNREGEAVLLTGRIRPADKEILLADYLPRMAVGSRASGREPLFVVATQTIEVGADLDFDALVTEHAPLSALRQRAGRLNRLGELASAPMTVVYQPRKDDGVYGGVLVEVKGKPKPALPETWTWLGKVAKRKVVDFGITALDRSIAVIPPPRELEVAAPLLLRSHLDLLAGNIDHGLEIAPWLHGWQHGTPDVHLCWRADRGMEGLEAAPPRQHELLAVPLWAVRRWSDEIADIEDAAPDNERAGTKRQCIRWDGETAEVISLRDARAGDTLVLPCEAGGCDRYGWAPASRAPVTDVGDDDRRMRLVPAVHPELASEIAALVDAEASASDWRRLAQQAGLPKPGHVRAVPDGCVVLAQGQWNSAQAYRPVLLHAHNRAVGDEVVALAQALGITDPGLLEGLRQAGTAHDAGKADPRWQARVGGDGATLLAKGPAADNPWLTLPHGWRHEMASAVKLHGAEPLVRYLVGTHHGHGRPVWPAAPDIALWRQMGDWAGLRAALVAEHGHWRLALLEALVRLADWRVSDREQREETPSGSEADRAAA